VTWRRGSAIRTTHRRCWLMLATRRRRSSSASDALVSPATAPLVPTASTYLGIVERRHRVATGAPIGYSDLAQDDAASKEGSR
jgi:hypothetical protein